MSVKILVGVQTLVIFNLYFILRTVYNLGMKLQTLLSEYAESHQNKTNILIHKICVPAITFSVIGLFMSIPFAPLGINISFYITALAGIYWLSLSWKYFLLTLPALGVFLMLSVYLKSIGVLLETSLAVFIISWIFQFYGHKVEGKKPSFFKDLQFLLIGPLWTIKSLLKLEN